MSVESENLLLTVENDLTAERKAYELLLAAQEESLAKIRRLICARDDLLDTEAEELIESVAPTRWQQEGRAEWEGPLVTIQHNGIRGLLRGSAL